MKKRFKPSPMPKARIIGGTHRSRVFETGDLPHTRPTKDRVKESMFNQIAPLMRFTKALDLFAGVGSLGFEALSRGVANVTFVESDKETFTWLEKNIQSLGFKPTLKCQDGLYFLNHQTEPFDLIMLDPPYQSELLEQALELIDKKKLLTDRGLIVGLHEKDIKNTPFQVKKHRQLGRTQITVWELL